MVAVAIHTGLRQSEQFHLRWEHVDFANGVLTVPRSKSRPRRHPDEGDVRTPTATKTATDSKMAKVAANGPAEVRVLPSESSGGARSRTADLGIMSGKKGDGNGEH